MFPFDHEIDDGSPIGHYYKAWDGKFYVVESQDKNGYNVVELGNPDERRSISERAIGRTFHHDRMCHCHTAIEAVEGLTAEELELLGPFDCAAYDLARENAKAEGNVLPMWLCWSDEARQEARDNLVKLLSQHAEDVTDEETARMAVNRSVLFGDKTVGKGVTLWRKAEAERKQARAEGCNPGAYFAG